MKMSSATLIFECITFTAVSVRGVAVGCTVVTKMKDIQGQK